MLYSHKSRTSSDIRSCIDHAPLPLGRRACPGTRSRQCLPPRVTQRVNQSSEDDGKTRCSASASPRRLPFSYTLCVVLPLEEFAKTSFYVLCSLVFLTCFRHILFCILFCYCECQLLLKNSLFFSSLTLFLSFLSPPLCSHPIPLFRTHFLCQKSPQFKIRDYTKKTKPNPPISFSLKSPSAYLRGGNGSGRGGQSGGRGVFARTW